MSFDAIRSAAVLGAGTMGSQIAAHFANVGLSVLLLDLTPEVARQGLARARTLKPDPFFTPDTASLIKTGGFDADWSRLAQVDWIVEAVVEQIDIKRALVERVDNIRRGDAIVTSNTSGIPLESIAAGRSEGFRRHWLGTHFFNPPRYLHLVEVVPTGDTDAAVVAAISQFLDRHLGKGVVIAKDTPNFIANHIGLYGVIQILRALESGEYTIEEIDAMTGPVLGRPKSATFRTIDIAGIDVLAMVANNLAGRLRGGDAAKTFAAPAILQSLLERGWLGEKTHQGFYQRRPSPAGPTEILVLDPSTLTYRPQVTPHLPVLDSARRIGELGDRIRSLFFGEDRVGAFLRQTLGPTLLYTALVSSDIAHSIDDIDRAMKWGFGWELGPFELWDAIGVNELVKAVAKDTVPDLVAETLKSGRNWFREDGVPAAAPDLEILRSARTRHRVVKSNAGASLVDLGDDVLAVEFHSKMNAIGPDTLHMLHAGLNEATAHFAALVLGTEAPHFSAGANLMLLLLEAQEGNWDEIDLMVRTFQRATRSIRYASVPVVVALKGLVLGGGCEIGLHADRVQAAAESYIGLTETAIGLIPAGGGTTAMLARAVDSGPKPVGSDLLALVQPVFEMIGLAKMSASAADARRIGFLRECDGVTMNHQRLMADAKALALERFRGGYQPPQPRAIEVGGEGVLAALKLGVHLAWRAGRISDHDVLVGRTLATILAGGSLPHRTAVSEEYLLDLEREAFLKLCGERKTLERIRYTLAHGKPLRN